MFKTDVRALAGSNAARQFDIGDENISTLLVAIEAEIPKPGFQKDSSLDTVFCEAQNSTSLQGAFCNARSVLLWRLAPLVVTH